MKRTTNATITRSYAAYKKKFEESQSKGYISESEHKYSEEEYGNLYRQADRQGQTKNMAKRAVEAQENMSATEARSLRAELNRQGLLKDLDGKIEFKYATEYRYSRYKKTPIPYQIKSAEIDFTGMSAKEQTEAIRRLPKQAIVPLLIEMGYSHKDALEFIGY